MKDKFYETIEKRRSIYSISKNINIDDKKLEELLGFAIKNAPSAFNSQSARIVLLLEKEHDKLWEIVKDELRKIVPVDKFPKTEEKIDSFKKGYGTILYFIDESVIDTFKNNFKSYANNFDVWKEQENAILQYLVWTTLARNNIGASLQHYNPIIDEEVKKQWSIPPSYILRAQMPFGRIEEPAGEKSFIPTEERIKVYK